MNLLLQRVNYEYGCTLGYLQDKTTSNILCVTLENPWLENQTNISCIPEGSYESIPYSSIKYPNVWELQNVKNRSKILIHAGNFERDTQGCILVGRTIADYNSEKMVTHSRNTLNKLRDIIGINNSFTLQVRDL